MSSRIKELRAKNATTLTAARGYMDEIKDDTPEDRAKELERQYDSAMSEYDQREAEIGRLVRLEAAEAAQNEADQRSRDERRPRPNQEDPNGNPDERGVAYKDVWAKAMRYGVSELTREERHALRGGFGTLDANALPPEQRALATSQGSSGGYLVPKDMLPDLEKQLAIWGPMLDGDNVSTVLRTESGNTMTLPAVDYTDERGNLKAENGEVLDDGSKDPQFTEKQLDAYVYPSGIVRVSLEMLEDSAWDMESLLDELFGESLGRTGNEVLTIGDGNNKPNGILNAAQSGKTANAQTAITGDELIDLQHSVNAAYRKSPKCLWQFNDTTLAVLRKLKDNDGNYIWQAANMQSGEPAQLLGHRYEINPAIPDIAAGATPVLFGDHSKYYVRRAGGPRMVRFGEKYMNQMQVGFMSFIRIDGECRNTSAIKKLTMAAA